MTSEVAEVAPAQSFGQFLLKALNDKDVPIEKMKLLLDAQSMMIVEQARVAYQEAFARFSDQMEQAEKGGRVNLGQGKAGFNFTTMAEIDRIARPRLSAERLSLNFTFAQDPATRMITVTGHLKGYGYEEQSSLAGMPDKGPGRDDIQAVGSTVAKLQRYIALGILNIVRSDEIVDGNQRRHIPASLYSSDSERGRDFVSARDDEDADI